MIDANIDKRLSLIIDQGGHGSRAAVCDTDGHILALAEQPIDTYRPRPLFVEIEAQQLLDSINRAIEQCLSQLPQPQLANIEYAALACQRSNVVCWSRTTGKALSPVISWQDRRASEWLQRQHLDPVEVRKITGLIANPHYGASKLRWCLDHLPRVQEALQADDLLYGPMASFLLFNLLQDRPLYVDAVNASRTLLWDWQEGQWSNELLKQFRLEPQRLPQSVPCRYDFGSLLWHKHEIPMQLVIGDLAAALYAYGQTQADSIYITAGTGAFLQRPCGQQPCLSDGLLGGVVLADERGIHYSLEGTVNGAGSAFDWLQKNYAIDNWIEILQQEPEPGDVMFMNTVSGLGSPYWISDKSPCFKGQGNANQQTFAVLESIVFLLYENFSCMYDVPDNAQQILINGGLSRNEGFCQRLANMCQLPVIRMQESEATVKGAARLLSGCLQVEGTGDEFKPAVDSGLLHRYQHWHQAMQSYLQEA